MILTTIRSIIDVAADVAILLTCVIIIRFLLTKQKKYITVMIEMRNALVALCNTIGVRNIEEILDGDLAIEDEDGEDENNPFYGR